MSKNNIEKLNLWDRIFNRYHKVIVQEGDETWHKTAYGYHVSGSEFSRYYVKYKIIDRVTGSERIEKEYLN